MDLAARIRGAAARMPARAPALLRRVGVPSAPSGSSLLALQNTIGNRGTASVLGSQTIQRQSVAPPPNPAETRLTESTPYPTAEERKRIREGFSPEQTEAEASGSAVPPVAAPSVFKSEVGSCLDAYLDSQLPRAKALVASAVKLPTPELGGLADVADRELHSRYGPYLSAGVHEPAEAARRTGYHLREHAHGTTESSVATEDVATQFAANRARQRCASIIAKHHALIGPGDRDEPLFLSSIREVFNRRSDDLKLVVTSGVAGYHADHEVYVTPYLVGEFTDTSAEVMRRGRWRTVGTFLHEMLHDLRHDRFAEAMKDVERSDLGVEGFAEYFTRPAYSHLAARAAGDDALRAAIEGVNAPSEPELISPRHGYDDYYEEVTQIKSLVGGSDEGLKAAYFLGRLEYIGLGGWNETEAKRRYPLRFPANELGIGIMLLQQGTGAEAMLRAEYTHILLGRGGPLQLDLGGTINYLTQGQRLGLGGTAALEYRWPELDVRGARIYVRGSLDVTASARPGQPFGNSLRLDLIPGLEAGVRFGAIRVGAGGVMLVPVAGGPIDDRVVRFGARLGISVEFGR